MNPLVVLIAVLQVITGCYHIEKNHNTHPISLQKRKEIYEARAEIRFGSKKDTIITKNYHGLQVPVTIKYADSTKGQILVLPGWNYPDTQWCEKTSLCKLAKDKKYDLVFVEMQRSVYLANYYPETKDDFKKYPTRTWLMDSVIQLLFQSGILDSIKPLFVMGISTGGRGAAILGLEFSEIFSAAATFSGDFDPEYEKNDLLMNYSLGAYHKFPDRWKGDNNLLRRAHEYKIPIYIGHGRMDKVSPINQSIRFADALRKQAPRVNVKTNFPHNQGHDYTYWNSEIPAVLNFFDEYFIEKRNRY